MERCDALASLDFRVLRSMYLFRRQYVFLKNIIYK